MHLVLLKSQLVGASRARPLHSTDKETRSLNKCRSNKDNKNNKKYAYVKPAINYMIGNGFLISK